MDAGPGGLDGSPDDVSEAVTVVAMVRSFKSICLEAHLYGVQAPMQNVQKASLALFMSCFEHRLLEKTSKQRELLGSA